MKTEKKECNELKKRPTPPNQPNRNRNRPGPLGRIIECKKGVSIMQG